MTTTQPPASTLQTTVAPHASAKSTAWQQVWLPLIYFTALTVLMTWPLATRMTNAILGQVGDNIYYVWLIQWFQKALFELHVSPLTVPFLNYPAGWSPAYTELPFSLVFIALPFSLLGGATLGYNIASLLTFIISGWGVSLWVRRLTGSSAAGLIAGTIFAFSPFRIAHFLVGHLNLTGTLWFPFYFMGLFDLLQARRWSWKPALLAGVMLGLIGLTSQYYLYMTVLVSAFIGLCFLVLTRLKPLTQAAFWANTGTLALAALPLVWLAAAPFLALQQQGALEDHPIAMAQRYSANPTDFILPSTDHFLWGGWVGAHFDRSFWPEATLYLGFIASILALVAVVTYRNSPHKRTIWLLVLAGLFAFILALGINLQWFGQPVTIHLSGFLKNWLHRAQVNVHLPGYYFFNYLPFYAKMRVPMRFGIFPIFSISVLAGLGAAWVLGKFKNARARAIAGFILLALVFIDFYPGPYTDFFQVMPRPVDLWLAQQSGQGAVAQFPFSLEGKQYLTYVTLINNKPFLGGSFNTFPPAQFRQISPVLNNFPDPASVALLRQLGVGYILVDASQYKNFAETQQNILLNGLRLTGVFDNEYVFQFP